MTYTQTIYAILVSTALIAGCQREAAAPAAAAPAAAPAASEGEDKVRIQLDFGKQGSVDYEKKDKPSN